MSRLKISSRMSLAQLDSRVQLTVIGIIVGVLGGFAALGLNFSLEKLSSLLEPNKKDLLVIVLPALGISATVLFLRYVMRDYGGHGLPEVIHSVSMKGGYLKLRSSVSRLVGNLLTLSVGGSAGPEAPVAMSGAAIGSNIATWFRTNEKISIAATGSGAAAAIASIFNAPIAGFIFSMEVILGEWSAVNMLPVALASVTGTVISRLFNGNQIPFEHRSIEVGLSDIFASVALALVMAFIAVLFIKAMRLAQSQFQSLLKPVFIRALTGGAGWRDHLHRSSGEGRRLWCDQEFAERGTFFGPADDSGLDSSENRGDISDLEQRGSRRSVRSFVGDRKLLRIFLLFASYPVFSASILFRA